MEYITMNEQNKQQIVDRIINNSFLKPYLEDEGITDISWNGTDLRLQHNKKGRMKAEIQPTIEQVRSLVKQIADVEGKEFTSGEPILDTEFGFLRVNAVHEAAAPYGMTFSIRVSRARLALTEIEDISNKNVAKLLELLIRSNSNILISGATGSGKTELQKLLVSFIPKHQKISLIEDTRDSHIKLLYPELDINSWQSLTDETRVNKITVSKLIKAALRNNPDWLIVSETRGSEAADMLDGAKTDHSLITTLHAKGAANIPTRLISMIRESASYANTTDMLLGKDIVELLPFGVHMEQKFENGEIKRFPKEIVEFTDFTDQGVQYTYLFRREKRYDEETGKYSTEDVFHPVSEKTKEHLIEKELYHLLPDVFKC
ncbi:CpaF/VirB11 family protein [Bacillus smithii]|uniref:CpaF/VirB11 family protein n=1 Tax=Bacillus smithii TaxID=1479 RepID=UPI002E1A621B|nr:CpaF/VirB11 family protein [Bacillus smithii]MED4928440.1 CpaF/VirB11 family protein [Bacillus smithii]